jgi:hypothetical protein
MASFYFVAWLFFGLLKSASLALHFLGRTPYGVPVVQDPIRFLPNAVVFEAGILLAFAAIFTCLEILGRRIRVPAGPFRASFLFVNAGWLLFGQFDQEVVRWLGNHITLSYLRTYAGSQDPHLLARLFGADLPYFFAGLFLGFAPAVFAVIFWYRRRSFGYAGGRFLAAATVTSAVFISFPFWWNFSEKRWRRIRPAGVEMAGDFVRELRGLDRPRHPDQAAADLQSFVVRGRLADLPSGGAVAPAPEYPLWRTSPGALTDRAFREAPRAGKPNLLIVMFETARGWRLGLTDDSTSHPAYPPLDAFLERESAYYPWTHSHGFPSVEGCASIHLGLWSHYSNVIISDYIHIRTRSLPEILRGVGYHAEMIFGYDPSFGNFTPWMDRWYDRLEYNPKNNVDGPLLKRVSTLIDTLSDEKPWMLTLWTTATHPPFDVPKTEHVVPAPDMDRKYDQSMAYAGREMLNFLERLKKRPDWNNTVVIMVGDHSTPTAWQIRNTERVGDLNPGHTWTSMAVLGGWPGLWEHGRRGMHRTTVAQADIGPTVLGLLNLRTGNHFMGRDVFADTSERSFMTARFDAAALVQNEDRLAFRMDGNNEATYFHVPKNRDAAYGMLDASVAPRTPPDTLFPRAAIDRYRDLLRAYGSLLDDNRLVPPGLYPDPIPTGRGAVK